MTDNYVADSFGNDLARLLPDRTGYPLDPSAPPVTPFLDRLPPAAAAALAAWDGLARAGAIPDLDGFEEGDQYGFDFVGNGCPVRDGGVDVSGDVWALGHDGGGNVHVIMLDGTVRCWDHETTELTPGGHESLDAFAQSLLHNAP